MGGRKDIRPAVGTTTTAASLVVAHLLDQQVGQQQLQQAWWSSTIFMTNQRHHLFSKEGLGARWRKESLGQAWDEKGRVDCPLWFSSFVKIQFGFSA